MKKSAYTANVILAIFLAALLLAVLLFRAVIPALMLRGINIPSMAAVSLLSLLAERSLIREIRHRKLAQGLLAAVTFALLPRAAGMVFTIWKILRYAIAGGLVFAACMALLDSLHERVEGSAALFAAAFMVFLASQGFASILI